MRRYVGILLCVFAAWGLAIAWYARTMPAYAGDLTRLAGLSERDYAWREPQAAFQPPLYAGDRFDAGTEILIVGDSMSLHRPMEQTDPGSYWPNYLAQASGLRVAALHRREVFIEELIDSAAYQAHPPQVLIFQFAERALLGAERVTLRAQSEGCGMPSAPWKALPLRPLDVAPQALAPPDTETDAFDFSLGAHALKQRILGWLPVQREVLEFRLKRDDLFSSRRSERLLVYWGELVKLGLKPDRVQPFWCALAQLQARVEADGRTQFLALMVPDRLTAYQAQLRDPPEGYPDFWSGLLKMPQLRAVDSLTPIRQALAAGQRDVYLPNDTHLGAVGHQLVAAAVRDAIAAGPASP